MKTVSGRRLLRRLLPNRSTIGFDAIGRELSNLRGFGFACEKDGRIRDAISVWSRLNQFRPDPSVEEHLVDLRCDPPVDVHTTTLFEPWPRRLNDPFPDVGTGPPEIDAGQLTMEVLGGAILHHGCLLVRGLIPRDRADELRATTDRVFAARERHLAGAPRSDTTPWFVPCARWDAIDGAHADTLRRFSDNCRAVHVADSPRALFQVIDALEYSRIVEVISEYLGDAAVLSVHKTMLRRVPPDAKPSWHQDGSFMGAGTRAVDIWVALSDCGEGTDAPGLAVLPRRCDALVRGEVSGTNGAFRTNDFDGASNGLRPVYPTCAPGDALLFDELLAHANGGGQPGLTRDRYALEAWMFAPRTLPATYLPMLA